MFPDGKHCIRHAPGPTTVKREPVKWPMREPTSRCAEGSTDRKPLQCGWCFYWWPEPNGQPLTSGRATRTGIWASGDDDWWKKAGLCVHHTAPPSGSSEMYYPRVTHATQDGCGAGETPEEVLARTKKE